MENTINENTMPNNLSINDSGGALKSESTSVPGPAIKFMTLSVVFMLSAFHSAKLLKPGHPMEVIPYAIGAMLAPVIMTGVVFLIFQIFKKFRTSRARWLIVFWTYAILLFSTFVESLQTLSAFLK